MKRVDDDAFQASARLASEEGKADSSLSHQVEIEFLRRLQDRKEVAHEKPA